MKTAQIRRAFLSYFEERSHTVVPSDSLIPSTDPTLLFTSAGMVQFKPHFQNPSASPYPRAASCQKCLRTSDIERVGHTLRHLTFFEMLGNFSFGDYFKKESIAWGWEFLTKTLSLPADRFIISVYKDDNEAYDLWKKLIPESRIVRLGEDSNFWTMGPTGPCGPCSEILWDRGDAWGKTGDFESDRYLEIWNHVFTQFDRAADGTLTPLPRKNIDTGMGLERLSLVVQDVSSAFDTDGFQALFSALSDLTGRPTPPRGAPGAAPAAEEIAFRRIADHARAVTFMICDGILPSNEGRGYVLRRLLRQAVRAGKTLGRNTPFFGSLTGAVVDSMQEAYPDLRQRRETIASVVRLEEQKFFETLETGTQRLEELVSAARSSKKTVLAGADVFQLYDTFGFPLELTQEMAAAAGLSVDLPTFEAAKKDAQTLARQGWKGSGAQDVDRYRQWQTQTGIKTVFRGYDTLEVSTLIPKPMHRLSAGGLEDVATLSVGEEGEIVFSETPFYAEGGGQVGDTGIIETLDGKAEVLDTQAPIDQFSVHRVRVISGRLSVGDQARLQVDAVRRDATRRHHTATHLLHKALREVLGPHVTQAGSLVAPDRLRFDFNHHAPLTREERQKVEDLVNQQILHDVPVKTCPMTKDDAHKVGAMMLFGEKYAQEVRAVMVSPHDCSQAASAWSLELCGGTHVHATGQVGLFKIISQTAVSAGVRRIEAAAGLQALDAVRKLEAQLSSAAEALKTTPDDLLPRIEKLLAAQRQLEKELAASKSSAIRSKFNDMAQSAVSVGGVTLITQKLSGVDDKQIREVADRLRESAKAGVVVLAAETDGKVSFVVSVDKAITPRGFHAGHIAREFAALIEGSGGGRPDFAQGGGKKAEALDGALAQVEAIIKRLPIKSGHST